MGGIKFLAGLGTILIFIGIYFFKSLSHKKIFKEETTELKNSANKIPYLLMGIISIILGCLLIVKAFKLI